jgi:hypothetical protein
MGEHMISDGIAAMWQVGSPPVQWRHNKACPLTHKPWVVALTEWVAHVRQDYRGASLVMGLQPCGEQAYLLCSGIIMRHAVMNVSFLLFFFVDMRLPYAFHFTYLNMSLPAGVHVFASW